MRKPIVMLLAFCLVNAPAIASEQDRTANSARQRLIISEKAVADALASTQPANTQRDSVKNGTIIGAVIGAAVMGGFVTFLCHALKEPGDPPCWKSSGLAIAIGASAGALGGAGIDALLVRSQPRFFLVHQPPRK